MKNDRPRIVPSARREAHRLCAALNWKQSTLGCAWRPALLAIESFIEVDDTFRNIGKYFPLITVVDKCFHFSCSFFFSRFSDFIEKRNNYFSLHFK